MSVDINIVGQVVWGFVVSGLIIYSLLCSLIYIQTKQKAFLYYGLYNFLLLVYLIKYNPLFPPEFVEAYINSRYIPFNWFIQVIYNSLLFFFYKELLDFKTYFPKYTRVLILSLQILMIFSFALVVFSIAIGNPVYFSTFFNYGFIPLITVAVISALYHTVRLDYKLKYFIISGVIFYQVFAYIALIKSNDSFEGDNPMLFFFIGIIIESTIFMLGLGYKVKLLYLEKINVQKIIIEEQQANQLLKENYQKELEIRLEEKISELKTALQKNEAEKLNSLTLSFESEISLLKLDALRSQMNPHFIFNALNSIKAYLIDNNKEKAVYYLNKFAKLIRKILESSRTDSVLLDEELETIELYMNIENIRFNDAINFNVNCAGNVNLSSTKLPGLILQPFIENALWHGLMLKEGEKFITIDVTSVDNIINLSITDNGIGRKKAKEKSDKKTFRKESLGIQFAQERLDYFNKKQGTNYSFTIFDLQDENNEITGTKVVFDFSKI